MQRNVAFRVRIADLHSNFEKGIEGEKQIFRVNIIGNIVDKFVNEERRYAAITIDDASSQIRIKSFGEDIKKFKDLEIGDTILVIGTLRFFANELYILPEIIRKIDSRWLLARKIELEGKAEEERKEEREGKKTEGKAEEEMEKEAKRKGEKIREQILALLKQKQEISIEELILKFNWPIEDINSVVSALLDEAAIYEPRPGIIRIL